MNRNIVLFSCVYLILVTSSCQQMARKMYGIKSPKPETNESVMEYVKSHNLDFDYLIRPKSDSLFQKVIHDISGGQFNGVRVFSSDGELLINTNDTSCHMTVRRKLTEAIRSGRVPKSVSSGGNIRDIVQSATICLNCDNQQPLFSQALKRYIVVLGIANFIPLKPKLSDVDYIQELKQEGLRDSVSIVLLNSDRLKN